MMPKDYMFLKVLFKTKKSKIFKMDDQDSLLSLRKITLNRKGIPIEVAKGLAKKFKLKKSFSRDLLSGNRLPEDVIDYQWPKLIYNSY